MKSCVWHVIYKTPGGTADILTVSPPYHEHGISPSLARLLCPYIKWYHCLHVPFTYPLLVFKSEYLLRYMIVLMLLSGDFKKNTFV